MLTKLLKISLPVLFSLLLFVLFIFPLSVKAQPPEGKVPENAIVVEPVNGITVGPGKKLWVFAFPAKGGKPGPPDGKGKGGGGETECPAPCVDDDTNPGLSLLGFKIPNGGLDVNINDSSIPIGGDVTGAIVNSFTTWNNASALGLSVNPSGGANGPAEDGNHTVGWVRIVPRNVLAATWVWTVNGEVENVDIFFNLFQKWEILNGCGGSKFDVEAICTHEAGHLIGLGHFSDDCKMATMYPSASKGEIKKRSLTVGDETGAGLVTP